MKKITLFLFAITLSFFFSGINAQSIIEINTFGGNFPGEKWVSITTGIDGSGTQIWGQGNGTQCDGAGLLTNEVVMLAPGTYYVNCYDQYDDSWDGTLISVTAYGSVIGDNGGVTPNDGADTDASFLCEGTAEELESSFEIIVPSPPSCLPPSAVLATPTSLTEATVSWTDDPTNTSFDYEWGVTGFVQSTGISDNTTMTSLDLTGLTAGQTYDIYVTANCGMDQSTTVGPITWTQPNLGDICGAPISIALESDCSSATPTTVDFSSAVALGNFSCDTAGTNVGFWFQFTTGITGGVVFNISGDDNELAIYDVACGTELFCTNNFTDSLSLSGLAPSTTYNVAVWRDDFNILGTSDVCFEEISCLFPTGLVSNVTSGTTTDISWTPGNTPSETAWEYVLQASGTGIPTGAGIATSTNPLMLTGLTGDDSYELYLRANCGGGSFSAWAGPITWTQIVPPLNDDPAGAEPLTVGVQFDDNSVLTSNLGATASENSDASIPAPGCSSYLGGDVWYTVMAPVSGTLIVETNRDPNSDPIIGDTGMAIYSGAIGSLAVEACDDDDSDDGAHALISLDLDGADSALASQLLYVRVFEYSNNAFGTWFTSAYAPLPNDDCSGAEVIESSDFGVTLTGTNVGATDSGLNGNNCDIGGNDVWYAFTAAQDGEVIMTIDSGFEYAFYADCAATDALACNASLTGATTGTTYYIRIGDDGSTTRLVPGTFSFSISGSALSTNGFDALESFKYYPNPVENILTLNAQQNIDNVNVYNILGQEVINLSPNTLETNVDMSQLKSGAYFVKVSILEASKTIRIIKE